MERGGWGASEVGGDESDVRRGLSDDNYWQRLLKG